MKKRIFIVLAVVASLVGCGKKNIEVKTPLEDEHAMVAGSWNGTDTDDTFYGKSYVSDGYYQIKNNLLQFTSYENGEDYVICTQTNCRHNNDSCAAWINGGVLPWVWHVIKTSCMWLIIPLINGYIH